MKLENINIAKKLQDKLEQVEQRLKSLDNFEPSPSLLTFSGDGRKTNMQTFSNFNNAEIVEAGEFAFKAAEAILRVEYAKIRAGYLRQIEALD